jgi:altronate dehydratase small subunit
MTEQIDGVEDRCFRVSATDNVATMLQDVSTGPVRVCGEPSSFLIWPREPIALGHKVAVIAIPKGDLIFKYGVPIGVSTASIQVGDWVHLHNCRSRVDERSSGLDPRSGAAKDTAYV